MKEVKFKRQEPTGVGVSLETYCTTRKYRGSVVARLRVVVTKMGEPEKYRTQSEWDEIYKKELSRVTK